MRIKSHDRALAPLVFTILILTAVFLSGCTSYSQGGGTDASSGKPDVTDEVSITIYGFKFVPQEVTITKGGTVTWTNMDMVKHDVKFGDEESPLIGKGESYSRKFDRTGTFDYICGVHPSMRGRVVVV